jgi:exodeoxyribonuclease VII large subunit
MQQRLDHARESLQRCLRYKVDAWKHALLHALRVLHARSPVRELIMRRNRFADLHRRLVACPARSIENASHRFNHVAGMLRVLGPEATLQRGFSITMDANGKLIRSVSAVRRKMRIRTRVNDGEFGSEVS